MGSDYWEGSKRGEPMEVMLPEAAQCAPLPVYIELRNELWNDLAHQKHDDLAKATQVARSLALLHLANTVVAVLLEAQCQSSEHAAELLRCDVCNTFIEHAAREVHARCYPELTLD